MDISNTQDINSKQRVLLAGATGLVGRNILHLLSEDNMIAEVRALIRHPLSTRDKSPLVQELISDFDRLQEHPEWFNVDIVFCALGTTIAKTKTREAFRRVDFEYPFAIAKAARLGGARHFIMVSAMGANAHSLFFYNRVKGELEEAILSLGYPSVTIARPSILLGEREEYRSGEMLAKKLSRLLPSPLAGVEALQVAAALVQAAHSSTLGLTILNNKKLRATLYRVSVS